MSAEDQVRLEAWLAGDVRRRGAYMRAQAVSVRSQRASALGPSYSAHAQRQDIDRRRRRFLLGGGGALAAAGAGAAVVVFNGSGGVAYASTIGEVRRISLPDGSYVVLNSASRVEARFDGERRRIRMLAGEALFETTEDAARPFSIVAEGVEVLARAAVLSMDLRADRMLRLTVEQGQARIQSQSLGARFGNDRSWVVDEGAAADIRPPRDWFADPDVRLVRLGSQDIARAHAWKDGKLAFTGQSFREAAAEFARYSRLRIRIADPVLADEPIVGLFAMDDPVGFATIVATAFDASVTRRGDEVIVAR